MAAYSPSNASNAVPVFIGGVPGGVAKGYQQIGTLSSSSTLTPAAGASNAVIAVSGAPVRWRADGTAPTASIGMPVAAGETLVVGGPLMSTIQFIQQSGTAELDVTYF
jgi:hypothetical protein